MKKGCVVPKSRSQKGGGSGEVEGRRMTIARKVVRIPRYTVVLELRASTELGPPWRCRGQLTGFYYVQNTALLISKEFTSTNDHLEELCSVAR